MRILFLNIGPERGTSAQKKGTSAGMKENKKQFNVNFGVKREQ